VLRRKFSQINIHCPDYVIELCIAFPSPVLLSSAKQIVPSSLRKRISSYLAGDPEVDQSSTQNKPDDGAEKDVGVLFDMAETPSEAWESGPVSVELTNVNWASADHPTLQSLAKINDDHLKEEDYNRPAVGSMLNGSIGIGLGTAVTLTSNILFSSRSISGPMQAPETEVARLQALLAAQNQVIQEKDCVIRDLTNQIIRQRDTS
jgi:hypothetical protein